MLKSSLGPSVTTWRTWSRYIHDKL